MGSILYGMSWDGGTNGFGVIFSYDYSNPQGIDELTIDNGAKVLVYPNPSNGSFNISIKDLSNKPQLIVYNLMGETVCESSLTTANASINIANKSAGIYLYRVVSEQGELISSGKLIIE